MAGVEGRSKMVSERYLGSAADIGTAVDAREVATRPERTRHLGFGDVAAVWGMLQRVGVVALVDEVVGARRADAGVSVGTYLALAALGRLVDLVPSWCSSSGGARPPRTGSPGSGSGCWTIAGSGSVPGFTPRPIGVERSPRRYGDTVVVARTYRF